MADSEAMAKVVITMPTDLYDRLYRATERRKLSAFCCQAISAELEKKKEPQPEPAE